MEGWELSEESKTRNSAAVKPQEIGPAEDEEIPKGTEKTRFWSWATLDYMSLDRSDVQYAAKEICTKMANPSPVSWKKLKEACRYLRGDEKVTWVMRAWTHDGVTVNVYVGLDWAIEPERKSTSRGVMMVNGTMVKHWLRTQASRRARQKSSVRQSSQGQLKTRRSQTN